MAMLQLQPNETILLVMRRHWLVFLRSMVLFLILLVVPSLFFAIAPQHLAFLRQPMVEPVTLWLFALYLMGLITYLLILWLGYYLDVWIITDQRIIDVEQQRLFHREVSEIAMDRIQNVTVETPGVLATLLRFGNIRIKTAGEGEFTISEVMEPERAKELILRNSRGRAGQQPVSVH